MSERGDRTLYWQLAYLAENFDFNDPEDAWAKREYKHIKELLGIPKYHSSNTKAKKDSYDSVKELFEDNYHENPTYETSVNDGTKVKQDE